MQTTDYVLGLAAAVGLLTGLLLLAALVVGGAQ